MNVGFENYLMFTHGCDYLGVYDKFYPGAWINENGSLEPLSIQIKRSTPRRRGSGEHLREFMLRYKIKSALTPIKIIDATPDVKALDQGDKILIFRCIKGYITLEQYFKQLGSNVVLNGIIKEQLHPLIEKWLHNLIEELREAKIIHRNIAPDAIVMNLSQFNITHELDLRLIRFEEALDYMTKDETIFNKHRMEDITAVKKICEQLHQSNNCRAKL